MAEVRLTDVYVPEVFEAAVDEAAVELNAFLQSGVMVPSPQIDAMAAVGGAIGELPFFKPLGTTTEPDIVTDNPATTSTPQKITGAYQIYRKANLHGSWSTMDLARELALKDPLGAIANGVGGWWATQREKRVIKSAMGVLADNIANDSSDMLYKVANDSSDAVTDAERISATAVIMACKTMGDHANALAVIAMHSTIFFRLQIQNLIDYIPSARSEVDIPFYLGKRVVVDDSLPAVAGTNRITYTCILFARGSWAYGTGSPMMPSELERKASAGNGGGQDILHSRSTDIIHPYGFQFISSGIASQSATLAELAAAAQWDRVYANRKNIGMAFLQVND